MDTSDGRIDSREVRIARNEALFREVNERVKEVSESAPAERIEFLCECGDEKCTQSISLSRSEYEALRSDPLLFGIERGHGIPDVEEVIAENDRFQTVRKHQDEGRIARATDPRA
jgi:hypothetical protein